MDSIKYEGVESFKNKAKELFGPDINNWRVTCPSCRRETTVKEFVDAGGDVETALQQCIGRLTGGRKGPHGCDWAAYGFFHGPDFIILPDRKVAVFRFSGLEPDNKEEST